MVSRTVVVLLAAATACSVASAQAGGALVDRTKPGPSPTPQVKPETRGDIFMAEKKYREAIDAYSEDPNKTAVTYNKIGIAYHQLQQLDNARKYYDRALKMKRDYAEAMNNIGAVYYAKKSYRRAIRYYERALKLQPSASVYSNLGTAYFARKKFDDATKAYEEALRLDPDVFEHRSNVGTLLEDRTIEDRAKFHYYLAKMYAKSGRNELALQYVRKALEEGFKERNKLNKDPEFEALRNTKEFQDLLTLEPRVL